MAIHWGPRGEQLKGYAAKSSKNARIAGHIYCVVNAAANDACNGWPKLVSCSRIRWWQYREMTVYVAFAESGDLFVLALGIGTRPANFDDAARAAIAALNEILKR